MSNTLLNGGSLKDTLKTGVKSLTDKDIIKNSIANGITSSLTTGITNQLNFGFNNQFTNALKEATVSTISNTVVESTLNGKSFEETLKDQFVTSIVMAGANLATKGIGSNYHEGNINKGTQLFLHGVTGAVTSKILGNDMASGTVSNEDWIKAGNESRIYNIQNSKNNWNKEMLQQGDINKTNILNNYNYNKNNHAK